MNNILPLRDDLHPLQGIVLIRCLACGYSFVLPRELCLDLPDITCGRCAAQGELAIDLEV